MTFLLSSPLLFSGWLLIHASPRRRERGIGLLREKGRSFHRSVPFTSNEGPDVCCAHEPTGAGSCVVEYIRRKSLQYPTVFTQRNQWRDQVPLPSTQGGVEVEDSCPKSFAKKQTVRQANFQPQLRHDHHRRSGQSYATSSHNLLRRALPGISGCKLQH